MSKSNQQTLPAEYTLSMAIATVLCDNGVKDSVRELRFSALRSLAGRIKSYRDHGYVERVVDAIAEKKCAFILAATTKTQMMEILKFSAPKYNGAEFFTGKYHVLEEELIGWSETSLRAPLSNTGTKRYMTVFKQVFPDVELPE